MIVSVNPHPSLSEFQKLMFQTDRLLNADALKRPKYYATRGGNPLEDDVKEALVESAKGTAFENTIEKNFWSKISRYYCCKILRHRGEKYQRKSLDINGKQYT